MWSLGQMTFRPKLAVIRRFENVWAFVAGPNDAEVNRHAAAAHESDPSFESIFGLHFERCCSVPV
jgi:hypothetical protein